MRLAIIGGTGKEGRGLALRWAAAGHEVLIGSRDAERGRAAASAMAELLAEDGHPEAAVSGGDNAWAAREATLAVLAVPYAAHGNTLGSLVGTLEGKILVDITVPLVPPKVRQVHVPPGHAAALEAQAALGEGVRVVAALHHISSMHLGQLGHTIDSDVLVCGDDEDARAQVIALIQDLGLRGLDAGALANAVALEALTPVLLHMNRHYKGRGCGVRITGILD